jgi:hypothetical protein
MNEFAVKPYKENNRRGDFERNELYLNKDTEEICSGAPTPGHTSVSKIHMSSRSDRAPTV